MTVDPHHTLAFGGLTQARVKPERFRRGQQATGLAEKRQGSAEATRGQGGR